MKIHPNQKEEVEEKVEEPKKSIFPCIKKKKKDLKKVDPLADDTKEKEKKGAGDQRRGSVNNKNRNSTPH